MKMSIALDEKSKPLRSKFHRNPSMMEINGIGNLPRDLIIEILSRLPVKVLSKFRCVSKEWFDLLTYDHHFIHQHIQQSKKNPIFLFRKYASSTETKLGINDNVIVELTGSNFSGDLVTKIDAPVGGPVNTFTSSGPLVVLICPYRIYVCNPGTQEFIRVPVSSTMSRYCTVGFGRCCFSDDDEYKIVHLFPGETFVVGPNDQGLKCEIFSLKNGRPNLDSGEWRKIRDCPYKIQTHGLSVSVGGFIYWMISDESNDLNNKSILSFNLETEEFEIITYPKCYSGQEQQSSIFLTGYKNCLCLVDTNSSRTSSSSSSSAMDIWLLKDRKKKIWVKEGSFNLSRLGGNNDVNHRIKGVVPCSENDVGIIIFNTEQHGLIEYDVVTNGFRKIKTESVESHNKLPCIYYDGFFSL
ncbi:hypothetical protein M9H77_24085 [Catharanthus roseus]|uniref:Uncharacterized protein n=1 Tax=Catharanthus roseus TaxID=4058 RepID=A0ACC0AWC7_CATRO|nr:hypothetical protein M9H77_24085 [Catharanthus roseus]